MWVDLFSLIMRQSFADFAATQQQRMDNLEQVLKYSEMLCEALFQDIERQHNNSGYKFYIESGRKYHKIVMECENGSKSVHAFIEKKFGAVYKPASWKAPAKHIRFTLLDDNSREECFARCDWAGGYLYCDYDKTNRLNIMSLNLVKNKQKNDTLALDHYLFEFDTP